MRQTFLVILSTVLLFVLMGVNPQDSFAKPHKDGKYSGNDWKRGDWKHGKRGDWKHGKRGDWKRGKRGDWKRGDWNSGKHNKYWKHKKYKKNKNRFNGVGYPGNGPILGNPGRGKGNGNWNLKGVGHPGHGLVHPAHGISHPVHGIVPKNPGNGKGKHKGWKRGW